MKELEFNLLGMEDPEVFLIKLFESLGLMVDRVEQIKKGGVVSYNITDNFFNQGCKESHSVTLGEKFTMAELLSAVDELEKEGYNFARSIEILSSENEEQGLS